jgi:hypothetical protein
VSCAGFLPSLVIAPSSNTYKIALTDEETTMQSSQQNAQKATTMPIGGFVIDAQGREIPITEEMIQQACKVLEKAQQQADKRK